MNSVNKCLVIISMLALSNYSWAGESEKGQHEGRQTQEQGQAQEEQRVREERQAQEQRQAQDEARQEWQRRQESQRENQSSQQRTAKEYRLAALAARAAVRPNMEVCEIEVENFVETNFTDSDLVISYAWGYSGSDGQASYAGVRRAGCALDEYIILINGSYDSCHNAHYGNIPSYLMRGYATGKCN